MEIDLKHCLLRLKTPTNIEGPMLDLDSLKTLLSLSLLIGNEPYYRKLVIGVKDRPF